MLLTHFHNVASDVSRTAKSSLVSTLPLDSKRCIKDKSKLRTMTNKLYAKSSKILVKRNNTSKTHDVTRLFS